ncbi:MAG: helix-turn-helix transcriptional regulator [Polyangiaceae bacterium]|nr:helix-turn-helix transcriptional regulator [Polyangiaceae bacterium]
MRPTALRRYLEVCEEGPRAFTSWCDAICETLQPLVAEHEGLAMWAGTNEHGGRTIVARGRAEVLVTDTLPEPTGADRQRVFDHRRDVAFSSELIGGDVRKFAEPFGFADYLGVIARAGVLHAVAIIPVDGDHQRSSRERGLRRLQRHLQASFAARWAPDSPSDADLILDPTGRPLHASSDGAHVLPYATQIARMIAGQIGAGALEDEAESIWDALWGGGWSIASTYDSDNKRLLVLKRRRVDPGARLTPRERDALQLAARGLSVKRAAIELGITASTLSTHLARGLKKLGLQNREELTQLGALGGYATDL